MAKVLIPTPLRQFVGKQDTVDLTGSTVGEVLNGLTSQFGDLRKHLYTEEGKLRSYVKVYLNELEGVDKVVISKSKEAAR